MPIKNGRLILQREVSDFSERFTIDPNNLLSVGTFVRVATSGTFDIEVTTGSSDNRAIGVIYSLDRTNNPYVALKGRCIVKVRGTVAKGDRLVLSDYKGMLVTNNSANIQDVKAVALTANSIQHGEVEAILGTA
tara:strand:+ start:31 stop:432 length:402 start_codon:yes stop_codon:yes gene_type:complete